MLSTLVQMSDPGSGPRATSTLVRAARRISAICAGGEQRIDRIGDAGGLGTEQRAEALRHERQQQADDVARADAERVKGVRGLRHAVEELAVAEAKRRLVGLGVGEEA